VITDWTALNAWARGQLWGFAAALALGGLLVLIALALVSRNRRRPIKPVLIWISSNLALLFNAEGMWVVATKTIHLTWSFALLVFAVFEIALLASESLAREQYLRTSRRDPNGKLIPGHPGNAIRVVWFIAISSGLVVASNATTYTEAALRIILPIIVVVLWWTALTAEGQSRRARGRFAYSPTRLAERWGWLVPDEDADFNRMAHSRKVHKMVRLIFAIQTSRRLRGWRQRRLCLLALSASDAVVTDVKDQLGRAQTIVGGIWTDVNLVGALQSDRHCDRQSDLQIDRQSGGQSDTQSGGQSGVQSGGQSGADLPPDCRQSDRQSDRHSGRHSGAKVTRQSDRQSGARRSSSGPPDRRQSGVSKRVMAEINRARRYLGTNGDATAADLAKKFGWTESTARRRLAEAVAGLTHNDDPQRINGHDLTT
jgi:hypothetical protein